MEPAQPIPMLDHPHREKVPLHIQPEPLLFQLMLMVPPAVHRGEEPGCSRAVQVPRASLQNGPAAQVPRATPLQLTPGHSL